MVFSEPLEAGSFDLADLSLTLDGGANLIGPAVTISEIYETTYRIEGLDALTGAAGASVETALGVQQDADQGRQRPLIAQLSKAANGLFDEADKRSRVSELAQGFQRPVVGEVMNRIQIHTSITGVYRVSCSSW